MIYKFQRVDDLNELLDPLENVEEFYDLTKWEVLLLII